MVKVNILFMLQVNKLRKLQHQKWPLAVAIYPQYGIIGCTFLIVQNFFYGLLCHWSILTNLLHIFCYKYTILLWILNVYTHPYPSTGSVSWFFIYLSKLKLFILICKYTRRKQCRVYDFYFFSLLINYFIMSSIFS